jgi:hypothetical protein
MTRQFWKFWVISAPVTIAVVVAWAIWIQRAEVARLLGTGTRRKKTKTKKRGEEQAREV